MKKLFCYLLFPFALACKKENTDATLNIPEPDPVVIQNTYTVVTAASSVSLVSGTEYRLGLAPFASFFKFDRGVSNGILYYNAILGSARNFKPLKFYILNDGTGKVVAVATPTEAEREEFDEEWD
ncbi:hypothetical protein [Chitinophaga sp. YIM B06452]|uniref:hypothetical protein n=1 Tax=Chitinophaga sp. YIM B06452 TaxID=3082158 RepID=UPI0031FEF504